MKRARALLITLAVVSILALSLTRTAAASLESEVAQATGIERTVNATLQARALERAHAIVTDFSHDVKYPFAEVIGWYRNVSDPVSTVVDGWMGSQEHRDILTSREFVTIGCAQLVADDPAEPGVDETHYFVCILGRAVPASDPFAPPAIPSAAPSTAPPIYPIPDTAMGTP